MLSWWAHYRARNTYTRTSLTSKTPTHTQHKESVPSLLLSPSRPAFPFQCYPGVVEKKVSPLALSVWFPITRLLCKPIPHPCFLFTCLTNIIYTISLMLLPNMQCKWDISKCLMDFHLKPISKGNLPLNFGSCKSSHMIFPQCVPLTHSSNSQTVNHYLILKFKLIVS